MTRLIVIKMALNKIKFNLSNIKIRVEQKIIPISNLLAEIMNRCVKNS